MQGRGAGLRQGVAEACKGTAVPRGTASERRTPRKRVR